MIKIRLLEFFAVISTKSILENFLIIAWILMPVLMMISKSLTDFFITLIAFSFLIKSTIKFSWSWLKINWV